MKFGLTENTVQKITNLISQYEEIEEAIIYGSRAKGNFRNGSDIDLVFKGAHLTLSLLNKLDQNLDDLMTPYKFDLSIYGHINNPDLKDHIQRIGITFFKRNLFLKNSDAVKQA